MKQLPSKISFNTNRPSVIYIAIPLYQQFPLTPLKSIWKAHETEDKISIRKISIDRNHTEYNEEWSIWFILQNEKGLFEAAILKQNHPQLALFVQQKDQNYDTCGGEEEVLSNVEGDHFLSCSSSSEESKEFSCESGLNGKHVDTKDGIWRTREMGICLSLE